MSHQYDIDIVNIDADDINNEYNCLLCRQCGYFESSNKETRNKKEVYCKHCNYLIIENTNKTLSNGKNSIKQQNKNKNKNKNKSIDTNTDIINPIKDRKDTNKSKLSDEIKNNKNSNDKMLNEIDKLVSLTSNNNPKSKLNSRVKIIDTDSCVAVNKLQGQKISHKKLKKIHSATSTSKVKKQSKNKFKKKGKRASGGAMLGKW